MDRCRGRSARSGWSSTQARGRTASGTLARLGRPPAAPGPDPREHRAAAEGSGGEEPGYCQEGEGGQGYRRSYCRRYDHNRGADGRRALGAGGVVGVGGGVHGGKKINRLLEGIVPGGGNFVKRLLN